MGPPGVQTRPWTLFVCLGCMFVGEVLAGPHYMVAFPAFIQPGDETKICASLLQPNESLVMTVTLSSQVLFQQTSSTQFHTCFQFQAPLVNKTEIQNVKVEVRGNTFYSQEVRKIMFKVHKPITFIQTDKPVYLPGQTVHFRVISMDSRFRPVNEQYDIIEMKDANDNRIGQWLNTTSGGKMLQLSHSLNSEAHEGVYGITVWVNDDHINKYFKVEKYVLPKFSIEVKSFYTISIGQEEINVEVDAAYTYGQAVPGTIQLEMCRPRRRTSVNGTHVQHPELCHRQTKQTAKNGYTPFVIKMSTFTKENQQTVQDQLVLNVRVQEEGTGISRSHTRTIEISYVVGKLFFIDTPKTYEQGVVLEGKIKAVHSNDTPVPHKLLHLLHGNARSVLQNLTTDSSGIATFSLNTTNFKGNIYLHASFTLLPTHRRPHYETAHHTLSLIQPFTPHSKTTSSLEVMKREKPLPCDKEETISIQYTIVGEAQGSVDVMYMVIARGLIVKQGVERVEVLDNLVTHGEVSFTLKVSPEMAPKVQLVAYTVLPSETVIANSAEFPTEKCLAHKVSLEFSPSPAVPGEDVTLQLTADPGALCGVSAVDQSVLIKEPGKTMTIDWIFSLLRDDNHIIHSEVEDEYPCLKVRQRRSYYYPRGPRHQDAYGVFERVGLKMATNLFIRMPTCVNFRGAIYYDKYHMISFGVGYGGSESSVPILTVRTFFPETWIWDLVEVGASGTTDMSLTVPDTITTWETEVFCLSSQGFGLAPRNKLTVFQPFFLELSLPYSIIRGEHFELKATIFNYLSSCMMVAVAAAPSEGYTLTPLSGDQYTSCLCANQRRTLSWTMSPSVLGAVNLTVRAEAVASHGSCDNEIVSVPDRGRIDVVTRSLIVKPEGIEITKAYNWLLCPKDWYGADLTEEIELQLPDNVIDGSSHASVSVLGDILGRALQNLGGLLRMPYGCGEQNIALLAPNIYILQYLRDTQQLTPAIKEKASNFLTSGYQRQLNYKHGNGAYSTFGTGGGNTWLTAFVLRSFVKAQSFVYIDPEIVVQSKTWLESKQEKNGSFEQSGALFNNRMKGGVSDQVTLSAYITAAFLEMNMSVTHRSVQRSLSCLRKSIRDLNNTYTTALLAYVFTLAGDMDTRAPLLQRLDAAALQQDGLLHWSQTGAETDSLSVEISSYVLLAKLSASPTTEDMGYASRIVRWLTQQQNPYGGFSSTQDTVVALQALTLYSTLTFSPGGSSTVTVQSPSGQLTFDVNQSNKLVYQEKMLQDVRGKHSLQAKGTACASVQISLHYNIPTPADISTLSVGATLEANCTSKSHTPTHTLKLTVLYSGGENISNMVILDIKMLSGFVPEPESLNALKRALLVERVEKKEDHILVYISNLIKDLDIVHILKVTQDLPVQNLKPAVVKIYDYYQPDDRAETEYVYPCAAGLFSEEVVFNYLSGLEVNVLFQFLSEAKKVFEAKLMCVF